ncbi:MAG: hypothetical protein JWM90_2919 [Thermoleophilia bacterium]|nr:hypothetical protein [Thermoleophilia bacterium]
MSARALTYPLRVIRARTRSLINRLLHDYEVRRGSKLAARDDRAPIFVISPPRSGSTLFFQLLVETFDIGWLANAHLEWHGGASVIERRRHPRDARTRSDFTSRHGDTEAAWEPSEGAGFWYRFFPKDPDRNELLAEDATPQRVGALRAAVRLLADACNGPVFFKNSLNTLRLPVIREALPEARYIHLSRDLEVNARSLLAGRIANGDVNAWWSATPRGAEAHDHETPAEQVVWQVQRINEVAREQLALVADANHMSATYEELVTDPRGTMDRVEAFLRASGVPVTRRADPNIPERFEQRAGGTLAPELEEQLRAAVTASHGRVDG